VGLLSTSYLGMINFICCAGVLIGSVVAVWHYTTNNELTMSAGQGAVLGLLAGLVGFAISFVLNYVLISFGVRSDLAITQLLIDRFGDSMGPDVVDQMLEQMSQEITLAKYAISALPGIAITSVFAAIGGAIGAAVFKKGPEDA
jgi:ABC-type antimicrobial peptide transport system permease subunit